MTPVELETYVRQRYNAVGNTFFTQAEIFNHFWAAQMELAQKTQCIKAIYTADSVANQRVYDFPTTTMSIARVEYDGERIYPNDFVDDDALTGNNPDESITGRPCNYQIFGYQLFLRPTPSTAVTGGIKVYSYNLPSQPTVVGTLDVPVIYHLYLADYALYCMFAKEMKTQMADYHRNLWERHKEQALATERTRMVGDSFRTVKDMDDLYEESRFI